MMKILKHFFQLLLWCGLLFIMLQVHLYEIPYFKTVTLAGVIFLIFLWGILFWKKTKGKILFPLFLALCILFPFSDVKADSSFCEAAESYHKQTFEAKLKNWKGDESCDKHFWQSWPEDAREKLNQLSQSPATFTPSDKLSSAQQRKWRSFREDSHWSKWVNDNFSSVSLLEREEMACAAMLTSLCSEYNRRHPEALGKTVKQIMEEEAQNSGCWPCEMSYIILTVIQTLSSDLSKNISEIAVGILEIFFLFWILYSAFQAIVFPSKGTQFLKELLIRGMMILIVGMLLSTNVTKNSESNLLGFYKAVISPIMGLGIGMTEEINKSIALNNAFSNEVFAYIPSTVNYCQNITQNASDNSNNDPWNQLLGKALPKLGQTYKNLKPDSKMMLITPQEEVALLCMIQRMYRMSSPLVAIGNSLIGFSWARRGFFSKVLGSVGITVPMLDFWIIGFFLVLLFTIFSFLVAFKIIDVFLKIGFVLVLMPLFVMASVFPLTREFTVKGFKFLMGIVSEFLAITLALNFVLVLFEAGIDTEKSTLISAMMANPSSDYGENLYSAITGGNGYYFFFLMVGVFIIGKHLLSVSSNLVSSLLGTAIVGGSISGAVAVSVLKRTGAYAKKAWDTGSFASANAESYHTPSDKSKSYVLGRAFGRLRSGQNPLKDMDNPFRKEADTTVSSAPKRYFGEKAGEGVSKTSERIARGLDRIGVTAGQTLQKTGIGAIVGVPLTLATKTLTMGIRATGKVTSTLVKAPGAIVHGIKQTPQAIKNVAQSTKKLPSYVGEKLSSGPKKIYNSFKEGVQKGKEK